MFGNIKTLLVILTLIGSSICAFQLDSEKKLLVDLLTDQISAGQCISKCAEISDHLEAAKCLTMCQSADAMCRYAWLCGAACKQACAKPKATVDLHLELQQSGCRLTWTVNVADIQPAFIVVGTDWTGMMSVFKEGTLNTDMELTETVVNKYREIDVLAVTAAGLVAIDSLEAQFEHCDLETDDSNDTEQAAKQSPMFREILFIVGSILCLVFSFTAAFIIFCLCYRTKKVEQNVEHAVLKPIIKQTADLPMIFKEKSQTAVYDAVYPTINFNENQRFLPISEL